MLLRGWPRTGQKNQKPVLGTINILERRNRLLLLYDVAGREGKAILEIFNHCITKKKQKWPQPNLYRIWPEPNFFVGKKDNW